MSTFPLLPPSEEFDFIGAVISWIGFVHNSILCLYHWHHLRTSDPVFDEIKRIWRVSTIAIFSNIIQALWYSIMQTPSLIFPCKFRVVSVCVILVLTKCIIYIFLVERTYGLFQQFEVGNIYKKIEKFIIRGILIPAYLLYGLFANLYYVNGIKYEFHTEYNYCNSHHPVYIDAIIVIFDIVFCVILSIIFARKLILYNIFISNGTLNRDDDTLKIATKTIFLSIIALIMLPLSLILYIVVAAGPSTLVIDSMINCWCIMLSISVHNKLYQYKCQQLQEKIITIKCLVYFTCTCCRDGCNANINQTNLAELVQVQQTT